jgi:endonuclease YncB( thermonuclease family)
MIQIKLISSFKLLFLLSIIFNYSIGNEGTAPVPALTNESNSTNFKEEVVRVIKPGVFDYQSTRFMVRMRVWGVEFPQRGQPGYNEALTFSEQKLLSSSPNIQLRQEFDLQNLKVVEVKLMKGQMDFSREAISLGIGWHLEKETNRYGPFVLSQLKAKRLNLGIWANNFNYKQIQSPTSSPSPLMPSMLNSQRSFVPSLSFWVSTFGKIHRPNCSFYQRGRGSLTSRPQGTDCRICGGRKPK